jgi:hypothetical protein
MCDTRGGAVAFPRHVATAYRGAMGRVLVVLGVLGTANMTDAQPGSAPGPAYAPPPPVYMASPERPERSDRGFVALGALVGGGGPPDWFYGAWFIEGGISLLRADSLRLRARVVAVLAGGTIESDWGGKFSRLGAGVEARTCMVGGGACLFADLDLGYQRLTLDDHGGDFVRSDTGTIVGPRIGVDVGAGVRVRPAIELYRMFSRYESSRITTSERRSFGTFALTLTVGYQF